jgi:hypothetical protein
MSLAKIGVFYPVSASVKEDRNQSKQAVWAASFGMKSTIVF